MTEQFQKKPYPEVLRHFISEVRAMADEMGVKEFLLAVPGAKLFASKGSLADIFSGKWSSIDSEENANKLTFGALCNVVQTMPRDDFGFYRVAEEMYGCRAAFHIYADKNQVNVWKDDLPVAAIRFEDDRVRLYNADQGRVDYDSYDEISYDLPLNEYNWSLWFHENADHVKRAIDIIMAESVNAGSSQPGKTSGQESTSTDQANGEDLRIATAWLNIISASPTPEQVAIALKSAFGNHMSGIPGDMTDKALAIILNECYNRYYPGFIEVLERDYPDITVKIYDLYDRFTMENSPFVNENPHLRLGRETRHLIRLMNTKAFPISKDEALGQLRATWDNHLKEHIVLGEYEKAMKAIINAADKLKTNKEDE